MDVSKSVTAEKHLFLRVFVNYIFILDHFKIKVMAPQIPVNFLFGNTKNSKLTNFIYIYI